MKVYFAADFARASEAEELAQRCAEQVGVEVVSRWHRQVAPKEARASGRIGGPPDSRAAVAAATRNTEDLDRADAVVVLTTGTMARGGRHFETGYAYSARKPIVLVGPTEHAFHHLPGIATATIESVCDILTSLTAAARPEAIRAVETPGRQVAQCVEAQGFDVPTSPTLSVDEALHTMWPALVEEELEEFRQALADRDLVEVADALADIIYVAYSAGASYGIPMDDVLAEVHRSNLSKVPADGAVVRRSDGKVMKPSAYSPPNLRDLLER